jgi:hypothetical protein
MKLFRARNREPQRGFIEPIPTDDTAQAEAFDVLEYQKRIERLHQEETALRLLRPQVRAMLEYHAAVPNPDCPIEDLEVQLSMAISLKRIADALQNNQIQDAVYNATYNALHQHWRDRA